MNEPLLEVPFLAPIPRGHEVLVAAMRHAEYTDPFWFVLDRTTGTLYVGEESWGIFSRSKTAVLDPIGFLAQWNWKPERCVEGKMVAATVASSNRGDSNFSRTRLFVDPSVAPPYR